MLRTTLLALCALLVPVVAPDRAHAGGDERTPFEMVRWAGADLQVQVRGTWYSLVALDGLPTARLLEAARRLDADDVNRRFCEDLVASLATIGHDLGSTAALTVRVPGTQEDVLLADVPATRDNRKRIHRARPWEIALRIARTHATEPDPAFAFLTIRHHGRVKGRWLTWGQALEDLDQLEWHVENVYSYRDLRPFDWRAAFDTIRLGIEQRGIAHFDFHIQLRKLLALFGDGHSSVPGISRVLPRGGLPFALGDVGGRVLALDRDGAPLDRRHPYLVSIDGVVIDEWLEAAAGCAAGRQPPSCAVSWGWPRAGPWRSSWPTPPGAVRRRCSSSPTSRCACAGAAPTPRARPRAAPATWPSLGWADVATTSRPSSGPSSASARRLAS
jgi:hypothetical protein